MVSAGTAFGLKVKRTRATAIAPAAPVVHASAPAATSPRRRVNRAAHSLMPPFRLMK
jgi:hypothetical protein